MAHYIHGFVARLEALRDAAAGLGGVVAALTQGFGFLPITKQLAGPEGPWPFEALERLTARLADWGVVQSARFPLAYIETEYFGGTGAQAAVAWQGGRVVYGRVVYGPDQSKSEWIDGRFVSVPLPDKAINRAVRLLGVDRGMAIDEFDALGLGRHRSDEGWLADGSSDAAPGTSSADS
jgi:hypothetical protein